MAGQTLTLRITPSVSGHVELISAPHAWTLEDGRFLAVIAGPRAFDHVRLARWMDSGCPDPAPIRQGFAAVLVDPRTGSAHMASGARSEITLHWASEGRTLVVSSHLRSLLETQKAPAFDEEGMARYLWNANGPQDTMYAGVTRLPAGHHASGSLGTTPDITRWFWPQHAEISNHANFPEQLREVIEDAVAESLPASGAVASHLSGGLDSTIVTAIAARHVRDQGGSIEALSHLVEPAHWPEWLTTDVDDTPFVEAFVRGTPGVELHRFDAPGRSILQSTRAIFESTAYPMLNPINAAWLQDIDDWVRARNIAVVMTGVHGSLGYSITRGSQYRRAISAGQFGLLRRDMLARHEHGDRWRHIGATTLQEFAPRTTFAVLRGLGRMNSQSDVSSNPYVIVPRPSGISDHRIQKSDRDWWTQSVLLDPPAQSVMQFPVGAAWGSDPLGDSEVLRTLFSAPPSAWLGDGTDRALARRTMKGLVVDDVRLRTRRGLQGADFGHAVHSQQVEYRRALDEISESGLARTFIDIPRLRASMDPEVPHKGRAGFDWQLSEGRILGFGMYLAWIESFLRR